MNIEGRGATKRNMRLALARETMRELESLPVTPENAERRDSLRVLIERLTGGRKIRKKEQSKTAFE